MSEIELKTPAQRAREKRDRAVYLEYREILGKYPEASRTQVKEMLSRKHGIHSNSGFYDALRRGEALAAGGK